MTAGNLQKESIKKIIDKKKPDIMLFNETALKGKRKIKLKGYLSFCRNREKVKGGVGTVVANYLQSNTVKVAEGTGDEEFLITRLDHVLPPVNIVNIYGGKKVDQQKTISWIVGEN